MASTLNIVILCLGFVVAARCIPIDPQPESEKPKGPTPPAPSDPAPSDPEEDPLGLADDDVTDEEPSEGEPETGGGGLNPIAPEMKFLNYSIHTEMKTAVEASQACKDEGAKLVLLIDWENQPFGQFMMMLDPDYQTVQRLLDAQTAEDKSEDGPSSWGGWCVSKEGKYMDINKEDNKDEPDMCRYASVKVTDMSGWKLSEMKVGWDKADNKHFYVCYKEVQNPFLSDETSEPEIPEESETPEEDEPEIPEDETPKTDEEKEGDSH